MLTSHNRTLLRNAGFIDIELQKFESADAFPNGPLENFPAWMTMMDSRREWVEDKINRGWTEDEIERELANYYRHDSRRTPFDFLRAEYRPPKKSRDYQNMITRRNKNIIKEELPNYF